MTALRITYPPSGPQVRVFGMRLHHGLVGAALILVGAVLCGDDRHDFPWLR